jgi:hypothetical protein
LNGSVLAYVSDSSGKVVLTISEKPINGEMSNTVSLADLSTGVYKLTVVESTSQKTINKEFSIV